MSMEVVKTCPLGSECETIRDNKLHRCRWYIEVVGEHPQTGESVREFDCAISWQPLLFIDNARQQSSVAQTLDSLRHSVEQNTKGQLLAAMRTSEALENGTVRVEKPVEGGS